MNHFEKRITKLEDYVATRHAAKSRGAAMVYITPNLEDDDGADNDYRINLGHGLFATAFDAPFSKSQIASLHAEYKPLTVKQAAEKLNVSHLWLVDEHGGQHEKSE